MGSKSQHSRKANFFAGKDYVFVSVDYPLFPEAGYSTQAKSVAQSIRWIYDHADEYNADPNNIILMGHSSGGHLASLVSTDTSYLAAVSLSPKNIKHTILLDAGGLDIVGIKDTLPFLYRKVYKPIFGSDVRHLREASPVTYISSGKDIPSFLIFYSTLMVFTDTDAMNFAQKLSENHIPNEIYGIELSHERISKNIGKPNDEVTKTIMAYLPQP
jgi:acetyl esterase/lipase